MKRRRWGYAVCWHERGKKARRGQLEGFVNRWAVGEKVPIYNHQRQKVGHLEVLRVWPVS